MGEVICPGCGAQRTGPNQFVKGYCRPCYNNRYIAQYRAAGRERPRKHRRTETRQPRAVRCDCGHDAVHRDVMVGGHKYNLCQDCYDLEKEGTNT